jgi:hypothetical protein
VHQEEHDNSRLGPRKAADFLTKRYQELYLQWGDGYAVLTGFGPRRESQAGPSTPVPLPPGR